MTNTLDNIYVKPSPQNFAYFIDGDIGEPSDYRELQQVLISMQEGDELELQINCFGGFLHTTTMLSNSIRNTKGHVHGVLNGVAMSGGSILLLSCHSVEVMPHSTFMSHTSNGYNGGKLSDTVRSVASSAKQLEALYRDVYYGFYTEEEITDILDGKDSYLEYDEICERLEKREAIIKAEYEQSLKKQFNLEESLLDFEEVLTKEQLLKLTKAELAAYVLGEISVDVDDNGKLIITEINNSVDNVESV